MARTRKIDKLDEIILGIMSGKFRDTRVRKWWSNADKDVGSREYCANGSSVDNIGESVNHFAGVAESYDTKMWEHKLPTIRYHIQKLVKLGHLRRTGNAGWGKSYNYSIVTDEQKQEKESMQKQREFRARFAKDLQAMLTAVNVETDGDSVYVDQYGMIEVKASDLARLLRENYTFETEVVYEDQSE